MSEQFMMEPNEKGRKMLLTSAAIVLVVMLAILAFILFVDDVEETTMKLDKKDYPIKDEEKNLRCKEIWEGDQLKERECRAEDVFAMEYDSYGGVAGSGSMQPFIHKGDTMYYRDVGKDELLWEDSIYVFRVNESTRIIHRLVGSYVGEDGEEYFLFKGDNNLVIDDPVRREQVELQLVGVCFEEASGLCD